MPNTTCELCNSSQDVSKIEIDPSPQGHLNQTLSVCALCQSQISKDESIKPNHWRCLSESMWSENPAVKVTAWRILNELRTEGWAQDLLDQLYLEEDQLEWAQAGQATPNDDSTESGQEVITKDSNGTVLSDGDSVTLIKDLEVKGAGFTAKRGTIVRKISLTGDAGLIEGKVNGTQIVLKTIFLKKVT